jgi:RNA-directed DNA polymerase
LPVLRSKLRSGNDSVRNQGRFCNIVGGVVNPLLANIFLHYVLDKWFEKEGRPRLQGEAFVIRYADDFVIGVAREDDARRIMDVSPKRMSKNGLTVHPEKTRLVRFEPPQDDNSETEDRDPPGPTTFDFLGFTHYRGRSQRGVWVVKRQTANGRLKRALAALSEWCRKNPHAPIKEQHQKLVQKLRGHYGYYGIIGNLYSLLEFRDGARRIWRRKLSRRRRAGNVTWVQFSRLERRYSLPRARVVHGLQSRVAKS